MKQLYVYSGDCRQGKVGAPTPLKDCTGKPLFIGDIVITSIIDEVGIRSNSGLSVVVSDMYESYADGTHSVVNQPGVCFVMGIRNIDFMGEDSENWMVKKVKSHKDVIDGEHWTAYGFNYKDH